ncbi:MAG: CoA transferase [Rhizobiales bacterium]|nr:CoA transferase [Hyphomicrobiales bacterium]
MTARADTALKDVLVVELGSRVGASVAGSLMAQLGADVVFIERQATPTSASSSWKQRHRTQFAAGKRSLLLEPHRDLVVSLAAQADVIVVSSDVDGEELDFSALSARAVVCDVSAYGRTSVNRSADTELQIQALTGIIETTGLSSGSPLPLPFPAVELMTGVYAAGAVLAAMRVRDLSGRGQLIDMALYDCAFAAMATFLPRVLTGDKTPIHRLGNRHPMIAPWNVYRAKDGWVLICVGNDAQWRRFCETIGKPELATDRRFLKTANRISNIDDVDAAVQGWVDGRTMAKAIETLSAIEIACGPVTPINEYPREANLDYRAMIRTLSEPVLGQAIAVPESPLRMSESSGQISGRLDAPDAGLEWCEQKLREVKSPPAPTSKADAPLRGVRIVEIGHYTTVPLSTRMLASLGAEVIKIEPPEGEATREWPPSQEGQGYFFTYMNSDKRSLMLDIRKPEDAESLRELLRSADVLIENLKPGALARRGFAPAQLAAINPRLISCSVSGFGVHSLYAGRPAYDTVIQAMSGVMAAIRDGDVPVKTGISSADLMGAEFAIVAVLAALAYRKRTGKAQIIDLSMQDIAAWMTQTLWNEDDSGGGKVRIIACSDRNLLVEATATDSLDDLAQLQPSYALPVNEVVAKLTSPGLRWAPIMTVHEMAESPETRSRQLWFDAIGDDGKTWPLLASPLRLTLTPPDVRSPMPRLGCDNEAILRRNRRDGPA